MLTDPMFWGCIGIYLMGFSEGLVVGWAVGWAKAKEKFFWK